MASALDVLAGVLFGGRSGGMLGAPNRTLNRSLSARGVTIGMIVPTISTVGVGALIACWY